MKIRIEDDYQLERAKETREKFQESLYVANHEDPPADMDPRIWKAHGDALKSVMAEMDAEITRYVSSRDGI